MDRFYTFIPRAKTKKINVIILFFFFFLLKIEQMTHPYDMYELLLVGS